MLGKLARWLRILGYDTSYHVFAEDDDLLIQAQAEDRILLTRDVPLSRRAPDNRCLLVLHGHLDDQMAQLVNTLNISLDRDPFTRCLACNTPIIEIGQKEAADLVPPYIQRTQTHFFKCVTCDQIYWRGTHVNRMDELLSLIRSRAESYSTSIDSPSRSQPSYE